MEYQVNRTTIGYYKGGVNSIIYLLKGDKIRNITENELNDYNKIYPKINMNLPLYISSNNNITRISIFSVELKKNGEPKFMKQLI